jgi:hypothetical protein
MKSSSFNKSITHLCVRKARPIEVHILRYVEYISPIDVLVPSCFIPSTAVALSAIFD